MGSRNVYLYEEGESTLQYEVAEEVKLKKVFEELLLIVFLFFVFSLNALCILSDKVSFRGIDAKLSMSTDQAEEVFEELDGVLVRCKMKYNRFTYNKILNRELSDINEIRAERKELNEAGKEYHYNKNKNITNSIGDLGYEYCYVSEYSPYVEYGFTREMFSEKGLRILKRLDNDLNIESIEVVESSTVREEAMGGALSNCNALDDFRNGTYTGDGVKIGLLETGIMDKNHVNISGSNYVIRSFLLNVKTEHATMMASIIAGNNGIARDATIYNAQVYGSMTNEMDWMIENEVDMINMSFGERLLTGEYATDSAVCDYYAKTYGVLIIASAGNDGQNNDYVGNPGLGYNVMTLGSVGMDDCHTSFTSFRTVVGPEKPTLCMYSISVSVPNYDSCYNGTSFAASLTTGHMAMLYELYPTLKTQPERAIALAAASAYMFEIYDIDTTNGLNDEVGSGSFKYDVMKANYSNSYLIANSPKSGGQVIYSRNVQMTGADKIKLCITWFAHATGEVDETTFTDYDIRIYNSAGQYLALGGSLDNNLEVLEFMAPYTDTYTIKIYQHDTTTLTERIGLAYQIVQA